MNSRIARASPPQKGKLWSVEACRAYAVLGVVLFHCYRSASTHTGVRAAGATMVGLDVFFVLSGFLVWKITRERSATPQAFLLHRLTRLAPMYWICTIGYFAILKWLHVDAFMRPATFGARDLTLSLLLFPHVDANGGLAPVLLPGWTLTYDAVYFIMFAVVLAFPRRLQLSVASLIYTVPSLYHFVAHPQGPLLFTLTHPHMWAFAGGIWLAEAWRRRIALPGPVAAASVLAVLASYGLMFVYNMNYHGLVGLVWIGISLLGVYSLLSLEMADWKVLRPPFYQLLADYSYSIFLLQSFGMILGCALLPGPLILKFCAGVVFSVILGALGYLFIEAPIGRGVAMLERRLGFRRGAGAVGAADRPALTPS